MATTLHVPNRVHDGKYFPSLGPDYSYIMGGRSRQQQAHGHVPTLLPHTSAYHHTTAPPPGLYLEPRRRLPSPTPPIAPQCDCYSRCDCENEHECRDRRRCYHCDRRRCDRCDRGGSASEGSCETCERRRRRRQDRMRSRSEVPPLHLDDSEEEWQAQKQPQRPARMQNQAQVQPQAQAQAQGQTQPQAQLQNQTQLRNQAQLRNQSDLYYQDYLYPQNPPQRQQARQTQQLAEAQTQTDKREERQEPKPAPIAPEINIDAPPVVYKVIRPPQRPPRRPRRKAVTPDMFDNYKPIADASCPCCAEVNQINVKRHNHGPKSAYPWYAGADKNSNKPLMPTEMPMRLYGNPYKPYDGTLDMDQLYSYLKPTYFDAVDERDGTQVFGPPNKWHEDILSANEMYSTGLTKLKKAVGKL